MKFHFNFEINLIIFKGVLLALLEKVGVIQEVPGPTSLNSTIGTVDPVLSAGTVAAGWQNFLICIEMFFAAIALRFAFPHSVYLNSAPRSNNGRVVTMQSISNNLKETMNPKDVIHDAIHNFHPNYQQYTQYSPQVISIIIFQPLCKDLRTKITNKQKSLIVTFNHLLLIFIFFSSYLNKFNINF